MDLKELLNDWTKFSYINPEDIPNIELYMDQITTFMDSQLEDCKRNPEDKILTKTMINNYSKNHLLPPSNKKRYSKEHIILLIFIYYLKNFLSITDIKNLLSPLLEMFYEQKDADLTLPEIYGKLFDTQKHHYETIKKDVFRTLNKSRDSFEDVTDETEKEFLQNLVFITTLSYDIYMKKRIIENMIDTLYDSGEKDKKEKKEKKEKKK
jgi:DNA-binding transcriptional MerR regulator